MIELPKCEELTFDDAIHRYRLNGVMVPSVTQLMEPLSATEYGTVSERVLKQAAERGTSVHNSIKDFIRYGINTVNEDFAGYMDAFETWWDKAKPEAIGTEVRIYHKIMRYAGTLDLIAMIDGKVTLVDYKTTSRVISKNCRVQLEGYSLALASHGIEVEQKAILHLTKDGAFKWWTFGAKDAEAVRTFIALKTLYDYINI